MIRTLRTVLLTALILGATLATAAAEARLQAFTLTPMVGYQGFDSELDLDSGTVYGLALGYNASRNWALELDARYVPTEAEVAGGPDVDVWTVTGNVLYHFQPEQAFVPYLVGGLGGLQYNVDGTGQDDEDFILNWGGGFKYAVSDMIDLRFDLRHTIDFRTDNEGSDQDEDVMNNVAATFGLTFQFGGFSNTPVTTAR